MSYGRQLQWLLLAQVITVVAVASCGSDKTKVVRGVAGTGGEAGEGGDATSPGGARPTGEAGTGPEGGNDAGGSAPQADGGATDGGATDGGATDGGATGGGATGGGATGGGATGGGATGGGATGGGAGVGADGGASPPEAGSGGAGGEAGSNIDPIVDVGVGCLPPPLLPRLSPTAAGLPKDGLVLWLRADRGVYATAAQRVCAWADQSGNQRLFLSNGANRPLFGASSLAAQAAIYFDGPPRWLSVPGVLDIPPTSARTFIAVVQLVSTTARFSAVMQGVGNSPGTYLNLDANTFNTQGSREGAYLTNNAYDSNLATSASPRVHVLTVNTMVPTTPVLSAFDYRVDGATQTLTRTAGGLGNGNIEDFSGANFTLVGLGAAAIMAEALIYNRALSVAERVTVETALKARYSIP